MERLPKTTVLGFCERESLAGADLGPVNRVATAGRLEGEALEIAGRLGSLPRATLLSLKRAGIASGEDFETSAQQEPALTQQMASSRWKEM